MKKSVELLEMRIRDEKQDLVACEKSPEEYERSIENRKKTIERKKGLIKDYESALRILEVVAKIGGHGHE